MNPCTTKPAAQLYDYNEAKYVNLRTALEILEALVAKGYRLPWSTDSRISSEDIINLTAEDVTKKALNICIRLLDQPKKVLESSVKSAPSSSKSVVSPGGAKVQKTKTLTKRIFTTIVESELVSMIKLVAKCAILYLSLLGSLIRCIKPSNRWSNLIQKKIVKVGPNKFKTTHLYLGGMPAFCSQRPNTRYVSMLEDYEAHSPLIREGVKNSTSRFPSPDFQAVDIQDIDKGVEAVKNHLNKQDVYLHCKAGYGRSGAIAVAYTMTQLEGNFRDVQHRYQVAHDLVKKIRPQLNVHKSELNIRKWYEERPTDNLLYQGSVTHL